MPRNKYEGHPSFPKTGLKFDKEVDSGPLPQGGGVTADFQQAVQDERIRRQVQSHSNVPSKKRKFYNVVE